MIKVLAMDKKMLRFLAVGQIEINNNVDVTMGKQLELMKCACEHHVSFSVPLLWRVVVGGGEPAVREL